MTTQFKTAAVCFAAFSMLLLASGLRADNSGVVLLFDDAESSETLAAPQDK